MQRTVGLWQHTRPSEKRKRRQEDAAAHIFRKRVPDAFHLAEQQLQEVRVQLAVPVCFDGRVSDPNEQVHYFNLAFPLAPCRNFGGAHLLQVDL